MKNPDTPLLSIRGLQHDYGGKTVLAINTLTLNSGDIVLLQGDNGAGKSTLLRIIAGLLPPRRCEEICFAGNSGKKATAPPQVVYLHQTPYLFSTTVRANVQYGLRCCRLPLAYADDAMQWAGISALADSSAAQLSGGEQRRVALARIYAMHPRLYLLDEPLAHLDNDGQQRIIALIGQLKQAGATAIISSHTTDLPATRHWQLINGDIQENT